MKFLAIDLGEKNIGLAVSDDRGIIAQPLDIIKRDSDEDAINQIVAQCNTHSIQKIVLGLPLSANLDRQKVFKDFAEKVESASNLKVDFWDETFSTKYAQNMLAFSDDIGKKKKTKTHRDDVAAAFILQEYLDHEKTN